MAQFRSISIPQDATVLISVVLHGDEIPKDKQGRFVAQVQQGGTGGAPESVKVKLFHGGWKGDDGPAKIQLRRLLEQGFAINNICSIADANREGFYTVRVWLTHDVSERAMSLSDWGEAGEFVADLLSYAWSGPKVIDHNDGKMISFGMYGRTIPPHYNYTVLIPQVAGNAEAPKVVAQAKPKAEAPTPAPKGVVKSSTPAMPETQLTAMERAFGNLK